MTLSSRSYKLDSRLYLSEHTLTSTDTVAAPKRVSVNHVYCVDISGSMYGSLPGMRKQLKNRLSDVIAPEDTITIIGFASTDECFVLKEMVKCSTPTELKQLHDAIDRFLVDMGCTDFVQPILATEKIISQNKNNHWNWVFLSDGGHNEGPFSDVINALDKIKDSIDGATIIEYGYWADSERLSKMAEILGGTKIAAPDFDSYVPVIEKTLSNGKFAKRVAVDVSAEILSNRKIPQMFYLDPVSETVHVINSENDKVMLPEDVKTFYTISSKVVGTNSKTAISDVSPMYAGAFVCSDLLQYGIVEAILNTIADTKFIDSYSTAFGKQKLFAFQNEIGAAVFNETVRGVVDPNFKPIDNKYCLVDLVNDLKEGKNLIHVVSPDFKYNRTSAKTVDKIELTEEEQKALAEAKTAAQTSKILEEANKRRVDMTMIDKGYPISDFTFNEDRANLSALLNISVDLKLPENEYKIDHIASHVFRNYTIIRDGIVNVESLPLTLCKETFDKISAVQSIIVSDVKETAEGYRCNVDISKIPVLNRKKVFACKKKTMTKLCLDLLDCKFELKYLGYLKKKHDISDEEFVKDTKISEDAAAWLATLGITSKGYSPKKEIEKSGDSYMSLNMTNGFKSFSSIPKIEDIAKKEAANKKLTPSEAYLKNVMEYVDKKYLNKSGDEYLAALKNTFVSITEKKRDLSNEIAQMKFAMMVARKWFADCENFDDNTDSIESSFGETLNIEYKFVEKKQIL